MTPDANISSRTPKALTQGRRGADGLSAEDVIRDQQQRLFDALVSVVSEKGFAAATVSGKTGSRLFQI